MNFHAQDRRPFASSFQKRSYPQVIKYMGSKARIIEFVLEGLTDARKGSQVCDLFAGACTLSGAIGNQTTVITNDIQSYSQAIAHLYLHPLSENARRLNIENICDEAQSIVDEVLKPFGKEFFYPPEATLHDFNLIEQRNRTLIDQDFGQKYHLFFKNYSGTWWSAEQCAWIDALRQVVDQLLAQQQIESGDHAILLTCAMHAMAYCGQGTGHYAQYRDAKSISSMKDINIYRQKSMRSYFSRKYCAVREWNEASVLPNPSHQYLSLDFRECLANVQDATIYADPPYAFVHYSRFYHAIETFIRYDYPSLQVIGGAIVKGRYREDRHQSPFSIRSLVPSAFEDMFKGVRAGKSNLVLSYSNTALLDLTSIMEIAADALGSQYVVEAVTTDHQHMTMGRRADRLRDVEEALIVAKCAE